MFGTETWRPVQGWPYQVSSRGHVRRDGRARVLKGKVHSHGYLRVVLCRPDGRREFYIHRLICEAFHGPAPAEGMHADHINGVRSDNRAANLRWLSPEDNRALRSIKRGSDHGNARLTDDDVRRIRAAGFVRGQDAKLARELGVSRETVRDARLGKLWRHV